MRRTRRLLYEHNTLKLELLTTPICRLALKTKGTRLETAVLQVRREMRRAGLKRLEPFFYLSDGYGCIEGTANISLGFYDCSTLLQDLHEEYRGWRHKETDVVHLVRHEVGHAFCYGYKLYRLRQFRSLFKVKGHFFRTYPSTDRYRPNPWSKDYVNPSGDHYAQKHPDDDFAETFAVWLTPRQNWRRRHRAKPGALRKLEFVDRVVRQYGRREPEVEYDRQEIVGPVEELTLTLGQFYRARPTKYLRRATGYVDRGLKELFHYAPPGRHRHRENHCLPATRYLRDHQRALISQVARWAGVEPVVVKDLLLKCRSRAQTMELCVRSDEHKATLVALASYLTKLCSNYARTGKYLSEIKER